MKIAILTSPNKLHHMFYIQEIVKQFNDIICIVEDDSFIANFKTKHPFEKEREIFEKEQFFYGKQKKISDICDTFKVKNINNQKSIKALVSFSPDIVISFGTRKINRDIISRFKRKIINLHGGDPEYYRGLDSHLWTIYHNDWSKITTTIHIINEQLDDGDIIQKYSLDISKISSISQLRTVNTKACVSLTISALNTYNTFGYFFTRPQNTSWRYYSFMPACLKTICVEKFNKHLKSL